MGNFIKLGLIIIFALSSQLVFGQTDTLVFKNNDFMVGEIKTMDKGILTIETDYSNSDFKVDWKELKRVYSRVNYLITLSDGRRYNGTVPGSWHYASIRYGSDLSLCE